MTPNKENFIKAIYEQNGHQEIVSNRQLVDILQVSAASITDMNARLVSENIITNIPYKGVQLTEKGIAIARQLVRKHRLWEVFLYEKLGYGWDELHQDADLLEHVSSDQLIDRLDAFLGHPTRDPHGAAIPNADGEISAETYQALADSQVGSQVVIKQVKDDEDLLAYLNQKEIALADHYEIIEIESFDGAFTLKDSEGVEKTLSNHAVSRIFVDEV